MAVTSVVKVAMTCKMQLAAAQFLRLPSGQTYMLDLRRLPSRIWR